MKRSLLLVFVLIIFLAGNSQAQNKKQGKKIVFIGVVVDSLNSPIANANFYVDGEKTKTVSNEQGQFRHRLKPSVKSIGVFALFNGYVEVEYQGEKTLTFVLPTNESSLEQDPHNIPLKPKDDLVDVGYELAHKKNLTSSVGQVKKDALKDARQYSNIYDMIRGQVPGVSVSGTSIKIRGTSTVNGSTAPLIIVDGVPMETISHIPPNDVKSISILKGPATAIYGSRGANGVVVITLKTGNDK